MTHNHSQAEFHTSTSATDLRVGNTVILTSRESTEETDLQQHIHETTLWLGIIQSLHQNHYCIDWLEPTDTGKQHDQWQLTPYDTDQMSNDTAVHIIVTNHIWLTDPLIMGETNWANLELIRQAGATLRFFNDTERSPKKQKDLPKYLTTLRTTLKRLQHTREKHNTLNRIDQIFTNTTQMAPNPHHELLEHTNPNNTDNLTPPNSPLPPPPLLPTPPPPPPSPESPHQPSPNTQNPTLNSHSQTKTTKTNTTTIIDHPKPTNTAGTSNNTQDTPKPPVKPTHTNTEDLHVPAPNTSKTPSRLNTLSNNSPTKESNDTGHPKESKHSTKQNRNTSKAPAATLNHGLELRQTTITTDNDPNNRGLFTTRKFSKNDDITTYTGQRISLSEAMTLRQNRQDSHIASLNQHEKINGDRNPKTGDGIAQFANDGSSMHGRPSRVNAKLFSVYDHKTATYNIVMRARRDIEPNEEVLISYGRGYWLNATRIHGNNTEHRPTPSTPTTRKIGEVDLTFSPPMSPAQICTRGPRTLSPHHKLNEEDLGQILALLLMPPSITITSYHSIDDLLDSGLESFNTHGTHVLNTSPELDKGFHWVVFHRDSVQGTYTLFDPLPTPNVFSQRVLHHLQHALGKPIQLQHLGYQNDDWSCGYHVIAILHHIHNNPQTPIPPNPVRNIAALIQNVLSSSTILPTPHLKPLQDALARLPPPKPDAHPPLSPSRKPPLPPKEPTVPHTDLPLNKNGFFASTPHLTKNNDTREGLALLGMRNTALTSDRNTDSVRCNTTQHYCPNMRVISVSREATEDIPGPTHIVGDVRSTALWLPPKTRTPSPTLISHNVTICILDYYFLNTLYFERDHGYGDKWFTDTIPSFFAHGGKLVILPNDKFNKVMKLWEAHTITPKLNTTATMCLHLIPDHQKHTNPLYHATDIATASPAWQHIHKDVRDKTNEQEKNWLDKDHPFLLIYNSTFFDKSGKALSYLRNKCTLPTPQKHHLSTTKTTQLTNPPPAHEAAPNQNPPLRTEAPIVKNTHKKPPNTSYTNNHKAAQIKRTTRPRSPTSTTKKRKTTTGTLTLHSKTTPTKIITPQRTLEGNFTWTEVGTRTMKQHPLERETYAKLDLKPGIMIPILGPIISDKTLATIQPALDKLLADCNANNTPTRNQIEVANRSSHYYTYQSTVHKHTVDGKPTQGETTTLKGLGVAMMINEPSKGQKPNCIFFRDHVLVTSPIKTGNPLLIYYGKHHKIIRWANNYSIEDSVIDHDHHRNTKFLIDPILLKNSIEKNLTLTQTVIDSTTKRQKLTNNPPQQQKPTTIGIPNPSNHCFLISTIQLCYSSSALKLQLAIAQTNKDGPIKHLHNILTAIDSGDPAAVTNLYTTFRNSLPTKYNGNRQQDLHEIFMTFINPELGPNPITHTFQDTCLNPSCGGGFVPPFSYCSTGAYDLLLQCPHSPMDKSVTLMDLINKSITRNEVYDRLCPQCQLQTGTFSRTITSKGNAPHYMLYYINRLTPVYNTLTKHYHITKSQSEVTCPLHLPLLIDGVTYHYTRKAAIVHTRPGLLTPPYDLEFDPPITGGHYITLRDTPTSTTILNDGLVSTGKPNLLEECSRIIVAVIYDLNTPILPTLTLLHTAQPQRHPKAKRRLNVDLEDDPNPSQHRNTPLEQNPITPPPIHPDLPPPTNRNRKPSHPNKPFPTTNDPKPNHPLGS